MTATCAASTTPADAAVYEAIGWRLAAHRDIRDTANALAQVSVVVVPGARWASVSRCRDDRLFTVASSDPVARAVDDLQSTLGVGPSWDALHADDPCVSVDLAAELRWSPFGRHAAREHAVASVLSTRLPVDAGDGFQAVLTIYNERVGAFDRATVHHATVLASCAGVGLEAVINRQRARHLAEALESNREIGVAMGVLMASRLLTRGQAFAELRKASQDGNRKLRDVASEVADTGVLLMPGSRRREGGARP